MLENISNIFKGRPALLLFDVNGTLLNTGPMQDAVNKAFQNEFAFQQWFSWVLHYSLVENVTEKYHDFSELGKAVMQMTVEAFSRNISKAQQLELVALMKTLPAHPDTTPGLAKLKEAGYKMVAFSNSPYKDTVLHLEENDLMHYFDSVLSVDSMKKFKPDLSTYREAAQKLEVDLSDTMLIAAHGWDVAGALRAGARAGFISRPGQALYPLAPTPEITGSTLLELAEKLIAMH